MLLIGNNISVVAQELNIPVTRVNAYKFEDESIGLYDAKDISDLLNVNVEFYKVYRAWFQTLGEWLNFDGNSRMVKINGHDIRVPITYGKEKIEFKDAFAFVLWMLMAWNMRGNNLDKFRNARGGDILWTIARINKIPFDKFMDKVAIIW